MLTLTQNAGAHLADVLANSNAPDETSLRLLEVEGTLKLAFDKAKPEDTHLDHDGRTVLVVDPRVADALDEKTLDVTRSPEGPQFELK